MVRPVTLIFLLAIGALSGCASVAGPSEDPRPVPAATESGYNRVLSQGYAQLYENAKGLAKLDEALLVKLESEPTEKVIKDVAGYAKELSGQLEKLARDYRSLSLDDTGLPLLEQRKRDSQKKDYVKALAPMKGATGADFERALLLVESSVLNQLRFLAQELANAEKSQARRQFALGVRDNLDRLYVDSMKLLDERFFRAPANSPLGAAGVASK